MQMGCLTPPRAGLALPRAFWLHLGMWCQPPCSPTGVEGAFSSALASLCAVIVAARGFHTWNHLFQVFAWSLGFLKSGMAPTCRHDGLPWTSQDTRARILAGSLPRAALLMVRGDWEWLCQCFRFRHYSADAFCWCCSATQIGPLTLFDVRPEAPYRATKLTHHR